MEGMDKKAITEFLVETRRTHNPDECTYRLIENALWYVSECVDKEGQYDTLIWLLENTFYTHKELKIFCNKLYSQRRL